MGTDSLVKRVRCGVTQEGSCGFSSIICDTTVLHTLKVYYTIVSVHVLPESRAGDLANVSSIVLVSQLLSLVNCYIMYKCWTPGVCIGTSWTRNDSASSGQSTDSITSLTNCMTVVFSYLGLYFTGPLKGIEEELHQHQARPKKGDFDGNPTCIHAHCVLYGVVVYK